MERSLYSFYDGPLRARLLGGFKEVRIPVDETWLGSMVEAGALKRMTRRGWGTEAVEIRGTLALWSATCLWRDGLAASGLQRMKVRFETVLDL